MLQFRGFSGPGKAQFANLSTQAKLVLLGQVGLTAVPRRYHEAQPKVVDIAGPTSVWNLSMARGPGDAILGFCMGPLKFRMNPESWARNVYKDIEPMIHDRMHLVCRPAKNRSLQYDPGLIIC